MAINFTTMFLRADNNNLLKDVGMIPYMLHKRHGWKSVVASYDNETEWQPLNKELKGLEHQLVEKKYNSLLLDGLLYLSKHSKEIDILNIYHLVLGRSLIWAWFYKALNPKGRVYLKLDIDFIGIEHDKSNGLYKKRIIKWLLKKIDIVSAETAYSYNYMKEQYRLDNLILVPNGYNLPEGYKLCDDIQSCKENIIFTAARLGTRQKATEVLLKGFCQTLEKHDWKLVLAGTIEKEFENELNAFYIEHPNAKNRVIYVGSITDKSELWEYYKKAKIFIMASRWEGFSLALVEAIANGCYPIVTENVISKEEITNNRQFGLVINDAVVEDVKNGIIQGISSSDNPKQYGEIQKYGLNTYSWDNIVDGLVSEFTKKFLYL